MYDYTQALQQRFTDKGQYKKEHEALDTVHRRLAQQMDHEQRDVLLDLLDCEDKLREKVALDNFIAGFRLATGIAHELSMEPSYSFDTEDEDRARQIYENEVERQNGKA